jgi:hypothetical protein
VRRHESNSEQGHPPAHTAAPIPAPLTRITTTAGAVTGTATAGTYALSHNTHLTTGLASLTILVFLLAMAQAIFAHLRDRHRDQTYRTTVTTLASQPGSSTQLLTFMAAREAIVSGQMESADITSVLTTAINATPTPRFIPAATPPITLPTAQIITSTPPGSP